MNPRAGMENLKETETFSPTGNRMTITRTSSCYPSSYNEVAITVKATSSFPQIYSSYAIMNRRQICTSNRKEDVGASKEIVLTVNAEKSNYTVMSHQPTRQNHSING